MKLSFAFCKEEMKQDKLTIWDRGTFLHLELLIFLYFGDRKKNWIFFLQITPFSFCHVWVLCQRHSFLCSHFQLTCHFIKKTSTVNKVKFKYSKLRAKLLWHLNKNKLSKLSKKLKSAIMKYFMNVYCYSAFHRIQLNGNAVNGEA